MNKVRFYFTDIETARQVLREGQGRCFINVNKTLRDGFIDLWTHDANKTAVKYGARIGETIATM